MGLRSVGCLSLMWKIFCAFQIILSRLHGRLKPAFPLFPLGKTWRRDSRSFFNCSHSLSISATSSLLPTISRKTWKCDIEPLSTTWRDQKKINIRLRVVSYLVIEHLPDVSVVGRVEPVFLFKSLVAQFDRSKLLTLQVLSCQPVLPVPGSNSLAGYRTL